jgi:hypothetical protein
VTSERGKTVHQVSLPEMPAEARVEQAVAAERSRLRTRLYELVTALEKALDKDPAEIMRTVTGYTDRKTQRRVMGKLNAHLLSDEHLQRSIADAEAWLRRSRPAVKAQAEQQEQETAGAAEWWDAVVLRLSGVVSPHNLHWVQACRGLRWDGDTFVVKAPSQQHVDWITRVYADKLRRAAVDLGKPETSFRLVPVVADVELHGGAL